MEFGEMTRLLLPTRRVLLLAPLLAIVEYVWHILVSPLWVCVPELAVLAGGACR